ncbi:MAG: ferredoxin FdxA [Myxococcota bacterium]
MPYVVAEPCIKCRFTDCVDVCPVDCFRAGETMLVIDPEECIDCSACVEECPVNAIYADSDLPDRWSEYAELNAVFSRQWPLISESQAPLPTAEAFRDVKEKRHLLTGARDEALGS